jgi:hypothetical protein
MDHLQPDHSIRQKNAVQLSALRTCAAWHCSGLSCYNGGLAIEGHAGDNIVRWVAPCLLQCVRA